QGLYRSEPECHGGRHHPGAGWLALPLPHTFPNGSRPGAICRRGESMSAATTLQPIVRPDMTPDALAALDKAGFSRRGFLKRAGLLLVGFSVAGGSEILEAQGTTVQPRQTPLNQVDSWLAIARDESVTAYSGKCDFGQGFATVQYQLVAEEL